MKTETRLDVAQGRPRIRVVFLLGLALAILSAAGAAGQPGPPAAEPHPAPLVGGAVVFDPTNFQQNLATAIRTAEAIRQRIEMIRNQIRQIDWMLENVEDLSDPTYREAASTLARLASQMERLTEGLTYSRRDLLRLFKQIYPHGEPARDLGAEEASRVHTTIETAEAALVAASEMSQAWRGSQATVRQMKEELLGTDGQLEALQSLGLLVSWVGEEVSLQSQQQTMTNNLLAVALSHWVSSYDSGSETLRRAIEQTHTGGRPYSSYEPLPVVPRAFPRRIFGGARP